MPFAQRAGARAPIPEATAPAGAIELRHHAAKGRAVHAARSIARGELIEAAPVIVIPGAECALVDRTVVAQYYFHWDGPENGGRGALALGALSLCNHSEQPRARVHRNYADQTLDLIALEPIAPGEEITIDYGCLLWFEPSE